MATATRAAIVFFVLRGFLRHDYVPGVYGYLNSNILGIDFTNRPNRRKPITCLACVLDGDVLQAGDLRELTSFDDFEVARH